MVHLPFKGIFVMPVFVFETLQIWQVVLGASGMNGLNNNSFICNPLEKTSQNFNFS